MTEAPRDTCDLLLMRHRDLVWGVENRRVVQVDRDGDDGGYRVALWDADGGSVGTRLRVDEVEGVAGGVPVTWTVRLLRRLWRMPVRGLGVHDGSPVLLVDPDDPPGPLTGRDFNSEGG